MERFGTPYGAYIYPLFPDRDGKAMVYWYHKTTGNLLTGTAQHIYELVLPYDDNGVITDVVYSTSTTDP